MATIQNIRQRAQELADKWKSLSISPEEVGLLIDDLAALVNDSVINGQSLGIRKTYSSVSNMNADNTSPTDAKGNKLRFGQLVAISSSDTDNGKIYAFTDPDWMYVTTVDAQYATVDDIDEVNGKLTELEIKDNNFAEIPNEGNLLDPNKIIKGKYVGPSGTFIENEGYGIIYIPMRGNPVSTNISGGAFLAATDKYGNITHVNPQSMETSKTILYEEGDFFAIVSVVLQNVGVTSAISYGEEIPEYKEYGFFPKEEAKTKFGNLTTKVENLESNINTLKPLADENYSYSTELGIETFNGTVITGIEISSGEKLSVSANGTAEWSRLLVQLFSADNYVQRVDNIVVGETRDIITTLNISRCALFVTTTKAGVVTIDIKKEGEFSKLKEEIENPTKGIDGNRITNNSIGLMKLSSDIIKKSKNLFNPNDTDVKVGYYLGSKGDLIENANYISSGFIPFTEDMKNLQASYDSTAINGGAFSVLYDSNKNAIKGIANATSRGMLTWEEGVAFARFSFNTGDINNDLQIEANNKVTSFELYGAKILESLLPKETDISILSSSLGNAAGTISREILNDSETLTLENFPWHIKKRLIMSFSASITSFSSILIGKGLEQYRGDYLKIDSTNITQLHYEQSESEKETIAHGLNIDTFIKVSLLSDNSGYLYVILQSKSGTFKYTFKSWAYEANWAPFVKSIGSVLTDLKLNAGCQDFRLPVWAFGDSYFGIASNRWIGAIRDMKFFNFLVNGLAGQGSNGAYNDLLRCLNFGTPKYLLWCLGMNDGDSSFISIFDKVLALCENKGITLIASTIPTVPDRDKEVISQYVRDSGVRYIDFYKAMGANAEGVWYDGYLDSDKVHPTSLGAQAQAMQVLIDFPELMQYGLTSTEGEIGDSVGDK